MAKYTGTCLFKISENDAPMDVYPHTRNEFHTSKFFISKYTPGHVWTEPVYVCESFGWFFGYPCI